MIYLNRVKWALRKLSVSAGDGLVLDVGSGGRPYPRSDILFDRLTGDDHRCGEAMMIDGRPTVFGDAKKLPFKDKVFDFVIASHLLEHISEPELFLSELQRVGKAGYIETPNAIFERLYPHPIHCLEVILVDNKLFIFKKASAVHDPFLGKIEFLKNDKGWGNFFHRNPAMFHTCFFWNNCIDYEVLNPDVSCDWIERINDESNKGQIKDTYMEEAIGWREIGQSVLNWWYGIKRKKRLRHFDLKQILACPKCKGELHKDEEKLNCSVCKMSFPYTPYADFTIS